MEDAVLLRVVGLCVKCMFGKTVSLYMGKKRAPSRVGVSESSQASESILPSQKR